MQMEIKHVPGEDRGDVMLYGLSTCGWCAKTKRLLDRHGVAFRYIYVDALRSGEKDKIIKEIKRWNPLCSFPTTIINNEICIVGFKEKEIKQALGLEG
jgi:glutaredoxin